MLDDAIAQSGRRIGVLVLTYPLNNACNPNSGPPDPGFERACDLAALAHAVKMIDPSKSTALHDWLFDNQPAIRDGSLTMDHAIAEASNLVDHDRLIQHLADDERAPTHVRVDIDRSRRLFPQRLPLPMMVMHSEAIRMPPTAEDLAAVLRQAVRPAPTPAPRN